MRTEVMVRFRVDAKDQDQAEEIVREELVNARQIYKKWYNDYDDSNGIVAFKIVKEDK